ncbi:MAG: gamma-glutamyl-gamma-aminobutyrate hydrolase family protein [Alistipes sp.]|nr:gamma-glutamyl-gamma-aminobutyrate hydrolase family protein [Alistipes sp.]
MKHLLSIIAALLLSTTAHAQLADRPAAIRAETSTCDISRRSTSRPVIGISVNDEARNSVRHPYTRAVELCGGLPVIIPMTDNTEILAELLSLIDGLILIGGDDIDPAYWNEPHHPRLGDLDTLRDVYDMRLLYMAERARMPILGICHGEQIVNVAFGGTLWQDLPSQRSVEHRQKAKDSLGFHDVRLIEGSRIAAIMGCETYKTNSFHHQAVRRVADGFRATGISGDGTVEVIEPIDNRPILCVQFHPEISIVRHGNYDMRAIFGWLMDEARKYSENKK